MGMTGVQGNENREMDMGIGMALGAKNKYRRMDFHDEDEEDLQMEKRRKDRRKYVFACSVFASLNSVLLMLKEKLLP